MLRMLMSAALAAAAMLACPQSGYAQADYPNRLVRIINPFIAGSAPDILARSLAATLSIQLGQQFIVENRIGASGALGTAAAVRADPDGYTLLFAPALVLSVLPQARTDTGYTPTSMVPICQTFINSMAVVVRPDSPIRSMSDLAAAAKQRPGALNYGHPGVMTIPHLAMEEFGQVAGAEIKDVPFRGGPQGIAELLGGRIDAVSLVVGTGIGDNIRMIGVFTEKRLAAYPNVPTVKEQGFDVTPVSFGGLLAPLGTPAPVLTKLASACADAAKDESYATTARRQGQPDDYYGDAAQFQRLLTRDIESKKRALAGVKTQPQ